MTRAKSHGNKGNAIAALGIVYGDIGTSPLYTVKECFLGSGLPVDEFNVLGVLSLIFWSLILVVTVKYVGLILRVHNHGEGGILALLALVGKRRLKFVPTPIVVTLGLLGAAMFWGDSVIMPAVSVLSALEGLSAITPALTVYVVPVAVCVIFCLFLAQSAGTKNVGKVFGPVLLAWFIAIGAFGLARIAQNPSVLRAFNPLCGLALITINPLRFLSLMGFVGLCVTGAEALYADMGHFSARTIRRVWLFVVLPCLLLNYFGQGAAVLLNPADIYDPFYALVPKKLLPGVVVLATLATAIASQAVISGMFSLCHQAIQLEYLPPMKCAHTSARFFGRVYVPFINWSLCLGVILVILFFKSSRHLVFAYGLSVSGAMVMTTLLAIIAARRILKWPLAAVVPVFGFLLGIDCLFFAANSLKFFEGAWLPVSFAAVIWAIMRVWHKERRYLSEKIRRRSMTFRQFFGNFRPDERRRFDGVGVYLSKDHDYVPYSLIKQMELTDSLPKQVIILSIINHAIAYVPKKEMVFIQRFNSGFTQIVGHFGFTQVAKVNDILEEAVARGLALNSEKRYFALLRALPYLSPEAGFFKKLTVKAFKILLNNSTGTSRYFETPPERTIELGVPFKLD